MTSRRVERRLSSCGSPGEFKIPNLAPISAHSRVNNWRNCRRPSCNPRRRGLHFEHNSQRAESACMSGEGDGRARPFVCYVASRSIRDFVSEELIIRFNYGRCCFGARRAGWTDGTLANNCAPNYLRASRFPGRSVRVTTARRKQLGNFWLRINRPSRASRCLRTASAASRETSSVLYVLWALLRENIFSPFFSLSLLLSLARSRHSCYVLS